MNEEEVRKLIAERKAKKEEEDERTELLKEKERREQGKAMAETLKQLEAAKEEKERLQREKEKKEDILYKQKLQEEIRREREERAKQQQQLPPQPQQQQQQPLERQPVQASFTSEIGSGISTVRLRLPDSRTVDEVLDIDCTLIDLKNRISDKFNLAPTSFHFRQTFPTKIFSVEEEHNSLKELNLFPNVTLIVTLNANSNAAPNNNSIAPQNNQFWLFYYISLTFNYVFSFLSWFMGAQPTPPPETSQSPYTPGGKVYHISSVEEYNKLRNTSKLVIVDISAVWCGPCKKIAPYYEQLAKQNPSVIFLHVDLDKFKHSISDLSGISSVPTFLYFKNKKHVTTVKGANGNAINSALQQYK